MNYYATKALVAVGGFLGGAALMALADAYATVLQQRIAVGWAEEFCRRAVNGD